MGSLIKAKRYNSNNLTACTVLLILEIIHIH
uniref:Uncharacterized protein n=1 Tax=Anguilla anguilla TaxID=7936 RepID=A0A0E9VTM9_ANGAN